MFKKILMWMLTSIVLTFGLIFIPSLVTVFALLTAGLIIPIDAWQNLLRRFFKGKWKALLAIILSLVTFCSVATVDTETTNDPALQAPGIATELPTDHVTETELLTEGTAPLTEAPTQTPTEPLTEAPTERSTEAPTQPPTEAPTEAPTQPPTEAPTEAPTQPPTEEPTSPPATEPKTTEPKATEPEHNEPVVSHITYVLNTKTKKFHLPSCNWLPTDNRQDTDMTRDEILAQGYEPCKRCDP